MADEKKEVSLFRRPIDPDQREQSTSIQVENLVVGDQKRRQLIKINSLVALKEISDGLLVNFSKVSQLNHIHTPFPGF